MRDLVERDVLSGNPGAYVCRVDSAEVSVPATVQATIAARIDRLGGAAKRTLHAAAVIGSRFDADLLACVDGDAALAELVDADLLDPVTGPAGRVRLPPPIDPRGGLRVATEIGPLAAAPAGSGGDPTT